VFQQVEAFRRPTSVPEALRLLQSGKGQARIVAGGTDAVVAGGDGVRILIDITRAGLSYIRRKPGVLAIGATTTLAEIEESALVRKMAGGILPAAAATCGSASIRNMATLGGNMANASSAADMAVPLLVLEASAVVADMRGRRKLPLAEYLAGAAAGRFSKAILVEVTVPEPPGGKRSGWAFQKLGRTAVDISLVSVAAGLGLDVKGRIKWSRIALGSVAPTALRAATAETLMAGQIASSALIADAAAEVARSVRPISDVRATAEYRREMSSVLTARAFAECIARAGGSL
jgi:CO/xanthine dehydrogenase FAD-binding subunit